ncbi:MAG: glycoside hydrolase family 65 protein [Bacteroidales bacterium]|nr:glycoside hydrolase family 65 protein [Bacteroidales bacterium]
MKILLVAALLLQSVICFAAADTTGWKIYVTDFSKYTGITLASGKIGIVSSSVPFKTEDIILAGAYDTHIYDKKNNLRTSRILKGPNFALMDMYVDGVKIIPSNVRDMKQVLDMKKAILITSFKYADKAEISYTTYALRSLPYAAVLDVRVKALKDISVSAAGEIACPQGYLNVRQCFKTPHDNDFYMPMLQTVAKGPYGRHTIAATASFVFDGFNPVLSEHVTDSLCHSLVFNKSVKKGRDLHFSWEGAVCTTKDFSDPQSESERIAIYIMDGNENSVISDHIKKWENLWSGDIKVFGDPESQRDIRLALYHLYAFSSAGSDLSISPMGLSSQGYNGHIFWDAELWMYPPLLLFNRDIARSMVNYRYNRLEKALNKAREYGFAGAMFPWESDDTGEEVTPTFALTGVFEQHITADVGIAFWNYFRVTGDEKWLEEKGFTVLKNIADFWVSRASENPDGSYSIKNVVGADEYAQNVDDDAFTNGSVKLVLDYACRAAVKSGCEPDPMWKKVADNMAFYKFSDGVTKEYKDYSGRIIKQADVNMLAYPLQLQTDSVSVLRDLKYYEPKIDKDGPAMGDAILSVLYARLGYPDDAYRLFKKAYVPNRRPPFGALAESASSNNPYFATGAGGMLQAVLFGFGGLEITDNGIEQLHPCLPSKWKELIITGVGPEKKTYSITR